ncbi:MAG: FtsX-like permease family protein [Acidobacteriota bacterium]
MKYLPLILRNLGRKKLRTAFTVLSIFVSFLLFGLLVALRTGFGQGVEVAGLDRLLTVHKVSLIQFLPVKYANFIETVDGVEAVTHWTWFGGYYQEPRNQLTMFATDVDGFLEVFDDYVISEEHKENWRNNRQGLGVGYSVAQRFGWEVGDRVPINTNLWLGDDGKSGWEFDVAAIIGDGEQADGGQLYLHYDYLKEGAGSMGAAMSPGSDELAVIGMIYMKVDDPERASTIIDTIDTQFANSSAETKTSTEKAWAQGFANQVGDLASIVTAIVSVVFFTLLLVAGNTMAQSVRERTSELGVLKTLGFSDGLVMFLVLGEAFFLALLGGLPGLLFANAVTSQLKLGVGFIPDIYIPSRDLMIGVVLVLALGLVTGALPAWRALRLRIIQALSQ